MTAIRGHHSGASYPQSRLLMSWLPSSGLGADRNRHQPQNCVLPDTSAAARQNCNIWAGAPMKVNRCKFVQMDANFCKQIIKVPLKMKEKITGEKTFA